MTKTFLGQPMPYLGEFETTLPHPRTPAEWALTFIARYGGIDGDHHKAWLLDQVARILHGTPVHVWEARWGADPEHPTMRNIRYRTGDPSLSYQQWVADIKAGSDGPDTYAYDEGIAP